jgi:hypothetical protein
MTPAGGMTVGRVLESRPEALGLDLDVVAGSAGVGRAITSAYVRKSGLALGEIAARNQLLRGRDAARALADRRERQLQLAGLDELGETDIEDFPAAGEER